MSNANSYLSGQTKQKGVEDPIAGRRHDEERPSPNFVTKSDLGVEPDSQHYISPVWVIKEDR